MNILSDDLPTQLNIDGHPVPIRYDYRSCVKIILAFEDEALSSYEKRGIFMNNLFPVIPDNIQEAAEQGGRFLNGDDLIVRGESTAPTMRLYSFSKDAGFIYAAFKQTHNVDLQVSQDMHWWKFLTLFMDLGPDTAFCNITGLRKRIKSGTATKEERKAAMEMGEIITLPEPDTRTASEKAAEQDFLRKVKEREMKRTQSNV